MTPSSIDLCVEYETSPYLRARVIFTETHFFFLVALFYAAPSIGPLTQDTYVTCVRYFGTAQPKVF